MFGVDGCSGCEAVEGGFEDTDMAEVVVAAFVVAAGAGAEVDAAAEVDGGEEVSELEGVLNSAGRT